MEKLLAYMSGLPLDAQAAFAQRCGTTVGYLRKAAYTKQKISEGLCLRIGAEAAGHVTPEDLRPDVDWVYLRAALGNTAQPAAESVAEQAV